MPLFRPKDYPYLEREVFGIRFPHPVALSPGFLPNGERYNAFRTFSFVEIGPLTIDPQMEIGVKGLFNKKSDTRAGMTANKGIRNAIAHIQSNRPRTIIAANIAPLFSRRSTEEVVADLTTAFSLMYDFADMFVIDTFRRNSDGVAPLQNVDILSEVLDSLLDMRRCYDGDKPILVRVSPLISRAILSDILNYIRLSGIDGIIAGFDSDPSDLVRDIVKMTDGRYPVIACGGITSAAKAEQLLSEGATLVQVSYTRAAGIVKYLNDKAQGIDKATIESTNID